MILTIDAGNTNVVFALFQGEKLAYSWRVETAFDITPEVIAKGCKRADVNPQDLEGGILASVVPSLNDSVRASFKELTGKDLLVVGDKGLDLGIEAKIDKPEEVGADRLINAIAGAHYYGTPLIVIDFGTATTFDVVGSGGDYLGGVICPGIRLSINALHEETAKLPLIEVRQPEGGKVTGKNTRDAMQSGIYFGYLSLIEGMVERLRTEHGARLKAIATGGYAALFAPKTDAIETHMPELTLQGLRLVFERNRG